MEHILFLNIMLVCSFTLVGAFYYYFIAAGKEKNRILLGVTLPLEILEMEQIQMLTKEYKKKIRKSMLILILLGIPVHVLMTGYISVFMTAYTIWGCALYLIPNMILKKAHKKLYKMKCDNQWNAGETRTIYIDTKAVALARKYPLSAWHFLGAAFIAMLPLYVSDSMKEFFQWEFTAVLFVTSLFTKLVLFLLYDFFYKGSSRVYSKDTKINQKCNRLKRNIWGNGFVVVAYLDSISFVILELGAKEVQYDRYFTERFILFTVVSMIEIAWIVYCGISFTKKKETILREDKQPIIVDEDEYWKNLVYDNPADKRIMVPDRVFESNFTFNMGQPAGRFLVYGFSIVSILAMVWVLVALLRMEFVPYSMEVQEESIQFTSGGYNLEVPIEDIEKVDFLTQLPDKRFIKINGGATAQYLLGKFRMEDAGECYMYVYLDYPAMIQINTKERIIFFNTKDEEKTEELYKKVCEQIGIK